MKTPEELRSTTVGHFSKELNKEFKVVLKVFAFGDREYAFQLLSEDGKTSFGSTTGFDSPSSAREAGLAKAYQHLELDEAREKYRKKNPKPAPVWEDYCISHGPLKALYLSSVEPELLEEAALRTDFANEGEEVYAVYLETEGDLHKWNRGGDEPSEEFVIVNQILEEAKAKGYEAVIFFA